MKFIKWAVLVIAAMGLGFLITLLSAQFVVWGLSMMHVNSGIWGPYLILTGMSMVITSSATLNRRR